jgi:nucleotide-binding universal stress UspA family protein
MYQRILMVVDIGIETDFVADYALVIANVSKAKFFLVPTGNDAEVLSTLKALQSRAEKEGLETEVLYIKKDLVKEVNRLVKDKKMDLIFVSLKGQRDGRFFIGSLAQRLMKHAKASVIGVRIVKARPITHHRRLLAPISYKDYYFKERLFLIEGLARSLNLKVSLFRCIKSKGKSFDKDEMEDFFKKNEEYLSSLKKDLLAGGIRTEVRVRVCENATDSILDEAMSGHFDLLFVRAIKRNIGKEFLSGNEVEEVLRRTPSNLLLWKSRE